MRSDVIDDMQEYRRKHGGLVLLSVIASVVCFGFLVFSDHIRIDTEELLNRPGSTLGWLTIGRYSLVLFKRLLGLGAHAVWKSGLFFMLFFTAGANLLTFSFYHISGKEEKYGYWSFLLLYATSNIWSYQIYFSLQQAEVALAMLLMLAAAFLAMRACFLADGRGNAVRLTLALIFLVLGLGAYQALASYYIAVCAALFLVYLDRQISKTEAAGKNDRKDGTERNNRDSVKRTLGGAAVLTVHFGVSYIAYNFIANRWFMATSEYMQDQKGWGRMAAADCIKCVLRTAKNVLLGYGPRNFSFYTFGLFLALIMLGILWKRKRLRGFDLAMRLLAMAVLLFSPFLMTLYMGEMLVTRSQFALPVAAAFLAMYGIRWLRELCSKGSADLKTGRQRDRGWTVNAAIFFVCMTAAIQTGYCFRLAYTDAERQRQDEEFTARILTELSDACGGTVPEQPVIFVGYHAPETDRWFARTEMYGWSFYEWDYSAGNPTGATHRIDGFIQAHAGIVMNEEISDEMRETAAAIARDMPDFPAEGAVRVTEEFVVVRLSEVEERTDLNWW